MMQETVIAVIGGNTPDAASARLAEAVGREIARRGAVLVCGGLGGVMDAAAAGARDAGGIVLGILPGSDAGAAAPGVSIPIPTGETAPVFLMIAPPSAAIALSLLTEPVFARLDPDLPHL